jgi:hypothetical protein
MGAVRFWAAAVTTAGALAASFVAGAFTLSNSNLTFQSKDRELDIRMVLIGLSILKGDPPPAEDGTPTSDGAALTTYSAGTSTAEASEENRKARLYAVHLLERYSGDLSSNTLAVLDGKFWEGWAASGGVPGPVSSTGWSTGSYTDSSYLDTYTPNGNWTSVGGSLSGTAAHGGWRSYGGSDGSIATASTYVYGSCEDLRAGVAKGEPITIAPDLVDQCLK